MKRTPRWLRQTAPPTSGTNRSRGRSRTPARPTRPTRIRLGPKLCDDLGERHAQRDRDAEQREERRVDLASFKTLPGTRVESSSRGCLLLRQTGSHTQVGDLAPDASLDR
jgi:hypothetical protein